MSSYASIQILGAPSTDEARDRLIYGVTAWMDAQGYVSCPREAAEHTVALAPTGKGWAVFDDCADRVDVACLHGLGRCLSGKMRVPAVGILAAGEGLMLGLYVDGLIKDVYFTSRRPFGAAAPLVWTHWGHARRWRGQLAPGVSVKELSAIFAQGLREGRTVYPRLRRALDLDRTADFGFASLEEAALPGRITLYFRAANRVRPGLLDRLFHPVNRAATTGGTLCRRSHCVRGRKS